MDLQQFSSVKILLKTPLSDEFVDFDIDEYSGMQYNTMFNIRTQMNNNRIQSHYKVVWKELLMNSALAFCVCDASEWVSERACVCDGCM